MTWRVIQWASGGVGKAAIQGILAHPDLELVACWVHSEAKTGLDVGAICGMQPLGIKATNDIDALLAMEADCIMYSPIMADPALVCRMLESGKECGHPLELVLSRKTRCQRTAGSMSRRQ